jgi:hypothetical protein
MGYYICGIYEERPEMCKKYPERDSYIPEGCTFFHTEDGERKGHCDPDCQASCCQLPRHQGEPTSPGLPDIAGGLPCKHLKYVERHPALDEEQARGGSAPSEGDREEHRSESSPVELALAEINRRKGDRAGAEEVGSRSRPGGGG